MLSSVEKSLDVRDSWKSLTHKRKSGGDTDPSLRTSEVCLRRELSSWETWTPLNVLKSETVPDLSDNPLDTETSLRGKWSLWVTRTVMTTGLNPEWFPTLTSDHLSSRSLYEESCRPEIPGPLRGPRWQPEGSPTPVGPTFRQEKNLGRDLLREVETKYSVTTYEC